MAIKFANNATTTIASGIVSTDTSITVVGSSGGLFPSAGGADYFYATLNNAANDIEIVKVTARSGDVMTVLRGQDGTVALDWIGGDKFELRLTAKALTDAASGVNITDLDGVEIGQSNPENASFLAVEAESLTISGIATGTTPSPGDSSAKFATTAFVSQNSGVPSGCIVLWSGASNNIPSGWLLCNGSNATPDLRNKFVIGAGSTYAVGATGGSADAIVVSHSHTASVNDPGHDHTVGFQNHTIDQNAGSAALVKQGTSNTSTEQTGISVSIDSTGGSGTNANLPPYYALCYIMKA